MDSRRREEPGKQFLSVDDKGRFQPFAGERLESFAKKLIMAAEKSGSTIVGVFNDTELIVPEDTKLKPADLIGIYEEKRRQYEESSLGVRAKKSRLEQGLKGQEAIDRLMGLAKVLDFTDYEGVLDWLSWLEEVSVSGALYDSREVLRILREHGFEPNVNLGRDLKRDDPENVARYIIGQAMDMLEKTGLIPSMYQSFAAEWKKDFGSEKE